MSFYFDDFIELAVVLVALYGFFCLLKKFWQKFVTIEPEKKRDAASVLKISLIGIIVGLLLYVTPFVNETVKVIISLLVTLGAFIGTFIMKEKKGYTFNLRIIIFIGQIFFGITMLLLMVNTNLGYSFLSVFAIWTIFNIYISKQFKKPENIILLGITAFGFAISVLNAYENTLSAVAWITILSIILLACEFFNIREKFIGKGIHNVLFTVLLIIFASQTKVDMALNIFIITLVFLIAIIALLILKKKEFNLKSFLIYVPFVVVVLLAGFEEDFQMIISLFNLMVAGWLLSEKSIYKKVLISIFMVISVCALLESTYLDEVIQLIIIASTALTFVYLFEKKVAPITNRHEIEEGVKEDEE